MANPNYGGSGAAAAARMLAYGVEAYLRRDGLKMDQYHSSFNLLDRLMTKRNGLAIQAGPKLIFDVWMDNAVTAVGVTRANEASTTFTRYAGDGTQGECIKSKYVATLKFTHEELMNAARYANKRVDIVKGRTRQVKEAFRSKLTTDMLTSQTNAENIIQGIPHALATANTVFGIDQSTYSNWQANVTTSVGVLDITRIDASIDVARDDKQSNPDLIVCGTGSVNTYQKMRDILTGNLLLTQAIRDGNGNMVTGVETFEYRGCEVMRERNMPSGELYILDSSTWGWWGDVSPTDVDGGGQMNRVDDMLMWEQLFVMEQALYCTKIKANTRYTGITN